MFGLDNTGSDLDTVAHIIQVALTPVFLLSGIATLLNVFSTRLARVADRVEAVGKALESADPDQAKVLAAQLAYLHRRSLALDLAVVLGAVGGAATCGAVLALFVGALREATIASVLFALWARHLLRARRHLRLHGGDADSQPRYPGRRSREPVHGPRVMHSTGRAVARMPAPRATLRDRPTAPWSAVLRELPTVQ
jgi:hypothetical protein